MKNKSFYSSVILILIAFTIKAQEVTPNQWAATDALGRRAVEFYNSDKTLNPDKYVGIFYHTWHIDHHVEYSYAPKNLTEILAANDESTIEQNWNHTAWGAGVNGPDGSPIYYWDESVFGYYRTTDEWVLRKHAEMLADAGVDVVFFDATNGSVTWKEGYTTLLKVWKQARLDGVNTPKIAFVLRLWGDYLQKPDDNVMTVSAIVELYEDLYKNPGEYSDLLFKWKGKPLLMAYKEALDYVSEAENASMEFTATNPFTMVSAECPSWSDNTGNLTMSLYKWDVDYETTISSTPITSEEFVDYTDNSHLRLTFPEQEAGKYIWVLDNAKQIVGVYSRNTSSDGTASYFNNSLLSNETYRSLIKYVGQSETWLGTGNESFGNSAHQINPGFNIDVINEIKDYFSFRPGQGDYANGPDYGRRKVEDTKATQWSWLETYPQHAFGENTDGSYEQVSVGIAQNASANSNNHCTSFNGPGTYGRNYSKKNSTWDNSEMAMYEGANFAEQWERANELDPELVFVTGWNEWTVSRWKDWGGCTGYAPVEVGFQDAIDGMRSRDIEPVKSWGKYGDAYYIQLVDNIRKFKGIEDAPIVSDSKTVNIGAFDSWADVTPEYKHYKGNTSHRNHAGAGTTSYTNTTGRNDIVKAKVARDTDNMYFYVETNENLSSESDPKWMRLFIDIDRNKSTGWEGYDYVLNRINPGATATLEKSTTDQWSWTEVEQVEYAISGKMMEVKIPRSALGLSADDEIKIEFKWSDNSIEDGNIMDFYVNGDAAPGGRFNFTYYTSTDGLSVHKLEKTAVNVYPNPSVSETVFQFTDNISSEVKVYIYNSGGQLIKQLTKNNSNTLIWDGKYESGKNVEKGIYFYLISTSNHEYSSGKIIRE